MSSLFYCPKCGSNSIRGGAALVHLAGCPVLENDGTVRQISDEAIMAYPSHLIPTRVIIKEGERIQGCITVNPLSLGPMPEPDPNKHEHISVAHEYMPEEYKGFRVLEPGSSQYNIHVAGCLLTLLKEHKANCNDPACAICMSMFRETFEKLAGRKVNDVEAAFFI